MIKVGCSDSSPQDTGLCLTTEEPNPLSVNSFAFSSLTTRLTEYTGSNLVLGFAIEAHIVRPSTNPYTGFFALLFGILMLLSFGLVGASLYKGI